MSPFDAADCAPSKLLSDIHYGLPHLSHVRFGGNFTDGSLSEILPGEIVHAGGWAGILLTISLLLIVCFYVLCCCVCVHCKRAKCTTHNSSAWQLLRYLSCILAILSVLVVLLAFWPEIRIHNGINSSTNDVRALVPEIAENVVDSALLSIEQQRHSLVISYLVFQLLFMIIAIFIIFFAQKCNCGAGVLIVMTILAVATTTLHVPLMVFLFAEIVLYADVCISIYSVDQGRLCMTVQQNISSTSVNPDSLDVFCNQTVYHGFILIMITVSQAALLILIQLFGFCYGALLCCTNRHKMNSLSISEERGISQHEMHVTSTTTNISSVIQWAPRQNHIGLEPVFPSSNSNEWFQIKNLIHATLMRARIIHLHRIHNKWLWNPYMQSKQRLSSKNNSAINEMLLFHGSSQTKPEAIYKSEKGFDFRFAGQGLWGEGTYFAVNAQYSHAYAHVLSNGKRQLILALVLTGESCHCNQDRSLKKPPLKDGNLVGDTMFANERYDSVRGQANGSDIYVVYEHEKAYPAYLITYELVS